MENQTPQIQYLKNYTSSEFLIDDIFLHFDLDEDHTIVKSILKMHRRASEKKSFAPLVLDGANMKLLSLTLDGSQLNEDQFKTDERSLTIFSVPDQFTLEIEVKIKPQDNKTLSGLYKSGKIFCTQCESHGFRNITYFLDRPDILTRFTTTISADRNLYPILLSNGNLVDSHELTDGRHWVKWEDPTLKPSYLFALVAGNLEVVEDIFITQSERSVKLAVYVEPGKRDQALHAMSSLKEAMRWDEVNYGREYELDMYMIVAVNDFNFGAMENKGLNIFNDKYILAKPETATDDDFINITAVIGHEYFHNWSGNRVTVRDWFQITLKEGLTALRERQFTADMTSEVTARIKENNNLRNVQFPEDAGPMAHPIYPDSYIEINNFYTSTVYDKGAEVIRMICTLLGPKRFRKAMDLYFSRNDGHAVTVEEFVAAMEDGGEIDLTQFRRWYKQAGTPKLTVTDAYFPKEQTYTLTIAQECSPTPGQPTKQPFHIPVSIGLFTAEGKELDIQLKGEAMTEATTTKVLSLQEPSQTFQFIHVPSKPIPSLLRDFSAPVKLVYDYSDEALVFLMTHDTNLFNRWYAGQTLMLRIYSNLIKDYQEEKAFTVPDYFYASLLHLFKESEMHNPALIAEMLTLPTEHHLVAEITPVDVDAIHIARNWLKREVAQKLSTQLMDYYQRHSDSVSYQLDFTSIGRRRLKNLALNYLTTLEDKDIYQLCFKQFKQANNMTDTMGAFNALNNTDAEEREQAIISFYQRWQHDSLIIDKWFSLQAQSTLPNTFSQVKALSKHAAFQVKNPNRVRALLGVFSTLNPVRFHDISGEPYAFLTDFVLEINAFNPQLASRMVMPLIHWKKFDETRQRLMKAQLERIAETKNLSNDLYEIVSKSLI